MTRIPALGGMSAPPPGPALGPRSGDRPHQDRPCARARARASSEEPTDSPPLVGAGDPAASRLPAGARNIGGGTRAVGRRRILQCLAHSLARAGCWGPAGGPPAPCGPRVVMGPPGSSKEVRSRFGAEGVDNYGKEGGSVAPSSLLLMRINGDSFNPIGFRAKEIQWPSMDSLISAAA